MTRNVLFGPSRRVIGGSAGAKIGTGICLLRYGRCVVFYEWWAEELDRGLQLEQQLRHVRPEQWCQQRQQTTGAQREQLKRFRFRRKRSTYLASLERRWKAVAQSVLLP